MIQKQLTNLLEYVGQKKKKKTTTATNKKTFIPIITIQDVDINQNTKLFKYNKTQETENSKTKKKKIYTLQDPSLAHMYPLLIMTCNS